MLDPGSRKYDSPPPPKLGHVPSPAQITTNISQEYKGFTFSHVLPGIWEVIPGTDDHSRQFKSAGREIYVKLSFGSFDDELEKVSDVVSQIGYELSDSGFEVNDVILETLFCLDHSPAAILTFEAAKDGNFESRHKIYAQSPVGSNVWVMIEGTLRSTDIKQMNYFEKLSPHIIIPLNFSPKSGT